VVGNGFGIGYGPTLYANASLNFVVVAGGNNSTLPNTTEITNQTLIQNSSQVSTNFPQTTTQITTSNSSQDVFSLNLFTDQSSYQQGQAVILFGNVTLNGQVISPDRGVPDRGKGVISITSDIPNFHSGTFTIYTDGSFSIMPFAAWSVGSHSFLGRAFVTTANGRHQVTDIVDFAVTPFPTLTDIGPQLQAIEELYNGTSTAPGVTAIPEGPIWTNPAYSNVRSEIPVATYGDYENLFIAGGPNDKGSNFVCGGYQAQVLKFFNSIRFNSDPNVRALLNGIDYGPVERGYGIFGGHHAVAVYPIGLDWNTILPPSYVGQETKIFDPWVYQQPNVESVPSFVAGWGFPKADGYYAATPDDPFGGKGYPITGNPVYQNDGPNGIVLPLLSPQNPQISVHIGSPVGALITNSEGQKTGMLPDGTLVQEFPAEVNQRFDSDNQTSGWYIGLYNNDTYTISLTGLRSNSSFNLEIGNAANPGVVLDYGERSVLAGQSAQLSVNNNADSNASQSTPPKLFMPDGSSVSPTVVLAPSNSGSQTSSGASGLIGLAITAGFVALIVSALWRRRKSH